MTVICPATVKVITPAHVHMHVDVLLSAGILAINTVGEPGAHGAGTTGTHGMGVRTPIAALVAAATVGLAMDIHMPKGGMFTIGLLSMILAAGGPPAMVLLTGSTIKELGATPKLHIIIAPLTTNCAIENPFVHLTRTEDSCRWLWHL